MFGYMLSQWYLSVVCDVRAPYSRGFNFSGIFLHHIVALPSGNSPTKNHEDRPRGSPPTGALNARGTSSLYVWLSHLVMSFLYILRVVTNTSLKMDPHFGSAGVQKYLHCRKCDWRLCCCWWNYCWKFCQIFLWDLYPNNTQRVLSYCTANFYGWKKIISAFHLGMTGCSIQNLVK